MEPWMMDTSSSDSGASHYQQELKQLLVLIAAANAPNPNQTPNQNQTQHEGSPQNQDNDDDPSGKNKQGAQDHTQDGAYHNIAQRRCDTGLHQPSPTTRNYATTSHNDIPTNIMTNISPPTPIPQRKRRRPGAPISVAVLAFVAVLGFGGLKLSEQSLGDVPAAMMGTSTVLIRDMFGTTASGGDNSEEGAASGEPPMEQQRMDQSLEQRGPEERIENEVTNNNSRTRSLVRDMPVVPEVDEDYEAAATAPLAAEEPPQPQEKPPPRLEEPPQPPPPLAPYTLEDTLSESDIFEDTFAIILYDPPEDKFVALYNKHSRWKTMNKKLWMTMQYLAYMLRRIFPERFTPDSPELALAVASGDYAHVRKGGLPREGAAPVFMFGSAFRDPAMYSSMIPMPMPEPHHLYCLEEWMSHGRVCKAMSAAMSTEGGELVFGEEYNLEWKDLIPQVIWRGTDFGYLPSLQPSAGFLGSPHPTTFFSLLKQEGDKRRNAVEALNENYNALLPRWKGAALTAQAELDAGGGLPWANIKMSTYRDEKKSATVGSKKYELWESIGIAVGRSKSLPELAKYKYHIDLGGAGGTSWIGTIEKLAMPGLLFHHVTPTKDYIHDRMQPWKHYVPVSHDLRDLKKQFKWAESHPQQAKRIAERGTEFMRRLATPEGMDQLIREDFVEPLRRAIEAYRPVASVYPGVTSWRDVLEKDNKVLPVYECAGFAADSGCRVIGGDDVREWRRTTYYKPL